MKKQDRKERYWEETNVAITCTTKKAQLAKYEKIYDGWEGKIFIQKTKKPKTTKKPQSATESLQALIVYGVFQPLMN